MIHPPTPAQLRNANFTVIFGGLDRQSVRGLLDRLAAAIEQGRPPSSLLPAEIPFAPGAIGISRGYAANEVAALVQAVLAGDPAAPAPAPRPAPQPVHAPDPRLQAATLLRVARVPDQHGPTKTPVIGIADGAGDPIGLLRFAFIEPAARERTATGLLIGLAPEPPEPWDWVIQDAAGRTAWRVAAVKGTRELRVAGFDGRDMGALVPMPPTGIRRVLARMWGGRAWADRTTEQCELRAGSAIVATIRRRGRRVFGVDGPAGMPVAQFEEPAGMAMAPAHAMIRVERGVADPTRSLALVAGILCPEIFPPADTRTLYA